MNDCWCGMRRDNFHACTDPLCGQDKSPIDITVKTSEYDLQIPTAKDKYIERLDKLEKNIADIKTALDILLRKNNLPDINNNYTCQVCNITFAPGNTNYYCGNTHCPTMTRVMCGISSSYAK